MSTSTCLHAHGNAKNFDPFDKPYQLDPAAALAWARADQPVFYAPKLGYWVVARYADIKAVFRDPVLFSPRNALEKITPFPQAANDVLASYGYAMNRTLVNEDEPAHTERRRVLMDHFLPDALAERAPMVQRLTREAVDSFASDGRADLVEQMFWHVPLTVALEFLGVPPGDMQQIKHFSMAHTLNTWGRPSPDQQMQLADSVGRFWQFAGEVLDRMRAEPDGTGWMHEAIRKNADLPDVVTDSYLHSMMMAIIVAAHETTAYAAANAVRLLLTDGAAWQAICEDASLIPNAVEECLRYSGSVVAWRRETTAPTTLNGVDLPGGAKLLIVTASANHDERHFENADRFDILRDNATDHLTFGYGAHQCMGKNLARMELRVFLEELTRRLPHLRLEDQEFTYLPNTSFRGPKHLWVRWDAAQNPDPGQPRADFPVGAPSRKDIARPVVVAARREEGEGIIGVTLTGAGGAELPDWTPGAHIDLEHDGWDRSYSICGGAKGRLQLAILREDNGRGGSRHFHQALQPGAALRMRGPRNHFRLDEDATCYTLIAGGIGITAIMPMARRLKELGANYRLHYCGRSRDKMAFVDQLVASHGDRLYLHLSASGSRADLSAIIGEPPAGGRVYACGPDRMIAELEAMNLPQGVLRVEHFKPAPEDAAANAAFTVTLADSGFDLAVPANGTLLQSLRAAGIDLASDCEEGLCGSCEVRVLSGQIDHRDKVLSLAERAAGDRMMACRSRAAPGAGLTIAL